MATPYPPTGNLLDLPVAEVLPDYGHYGHTSPTHHGVGLTSMIQKHPVASAVVLSILILITIILVVILHKNKNKKSGFEGLATDSLSKSPCPAGTTALTYQDVDGALLTRCVSNGGLPSMNNSACKQIWDPAAAAEAEALAAVGSYQHDHYGERSLQHAINAAYDRNVPLNEVQLNEFLHQGGSP